ncbi:MAG: hypothetical protein AAGH19_04670 [Pseudomonadota bacterium]
MSGLPLDLELACERCGRHLNPDKAVWLDLNGQTNRYRRKPWPEGVSQGSFAFGPGCADRVLHRKGKLDIQHGVAL